MNTFDFTDICTNSGNSIVSISNVMYLLMTSVVLILTENTIVRILCIIIFTSILLVLYIPIKLLDNTDLLDKTKLSYQILSGILVGINLLLYSFSPNYTILAFNLLIFSIPALLSIL